MLTEAVNEYFILNGKEHKLSESEMEISIEKPILYEVNRVMDGVVLFEEGHISRLNDSIELLGYKMDYKPEDISEMMKKLIELNGVVNQNIKIVYGNLEKEQQILLYFVNSNYPEKSLYEKGVCTILFETERENPNAKILNQSLRDRINERIEQENAFEALLVDEKGNITEGSRSNFFYLKDGKLYTPPAEKVLLGITRREVIDAAEKSGIELSEKSLSIKEIRDIEGAFITGTSIDALPISKIDDVELKTPQNSIMKKIMIKYNERVSEYIRENKKKA